MLTAAAITLVIFLSLVYTSSRYASIMDSTRPLTYDEIEREFSHPYFTPSSDVITPIDDNYKISGAAICNGITSNTVILLVPSVMHDKKIRNTLRKTWLKGLVDGNWPNAKLENNFRVAFIFGKGKSNEDDETLFWENSVHGDIVQGSFEDNYFSLTRKTLFGLKWVTKHCSEARYVMKIDVDTFVNVPKLFKKISLYSDGNDDGKIFGRLWEKSMPHRTGKWKIGLENYPAKYYPPYCDGPIYVISASAVPKIIYTSERMPYFHLEDVFVTGIAARISNVNRLDVLEKVDFRNKPEWVCSFHMAADDRPIHLADSEFTPEEIEDIWRCMHEGPTVKDYYNYYTRHRMRSLILTCLFLILVVVIYILMNSEKK